MEVRPGGVGHREPHEFGSGLQGRVVPGNRGPREAGGDDIAITVVLTLGTEPCMFIL